MSVEEIRLRHARRLSKAHQTNSVENAGLLVHAQKAPRLSNPHTALYSIMLEQCRSFAIALRNAAPRIARACMWWCDEMRSDEHALLNSAITEMEMCLGYGSGGAGCCASAGLLNPGAQSISYVAASQHGRIGGCSIKAGQGMAFKCIDENKTIVVPNLYMAKRLGVHVSKNSRDIFPCVCTPLRAEFGRPIGVLSVDSLSIDTDILAGNANPVDFHERLAPFLENNDEACRRVPFWRMEKQSMVNPSTRIAARVIHGQISSIERRGHLGSVYGLCWEDGLCEHNIPFRTIKERLRSTPALFGIGVPCDAALLGFVEYTGKVIGEQLIRLRLRVHASDIKQVPYVPNITITDLFHNSLASMMCCIVHAEAAEIWEYDAHQQLSVIARMGHNFAFCTMSTTRRLLEIPAHKRYLFWDKIKGGLTFPMPFVNHTMVTPFACYQPKKEKKGLLLVTLCAFHNLDANDLIFIHKMGSALTSAHEWMSLREARAQMRKLALQRIGSMCLDHGTTVRELIPALRTRVSQCFPQSSVQLGYLELGGDRVTIMGNVEYRRNKSLEFDCVPPAICASLTVSNPVKIQRKEYLPGTRVQVQYGKLWYLAVIHLNRGHLTYDVTYDLKDWMGRPVREAGVPIARLKPIPARQFRGFPQCRCEVKTTAHDDIHCWPYLLVPLGCMRGIIYFSSWAISSPEPNFDELNIIGFLQTAGISLGMAMDDKVRGGALRYMRSFTKNSVSLSSKEIKKKMIWLLNECAMLAKSLLLYNLVDLYSNARFLPVSKNSNMTSLIIRCMEISTNLSLLDSSLLIESDAVYTVFLTVFDETKKVLNSRNSAVVSSRSFIFLSSKYTAITREDMAFCMKLSELAKVPLAQISTLEQSALLRIKTLRALEALIKHKPAELSRSLQIAGTHISETVNRLNVFIAYVLPDDGPLRIVWSSTKPLKAGPSANTLLIKRRSKHLMVQCLITKQPIVFEELGEAAHKLHYSKSRGTKFWPWICAPVTTRGILVLDAGLQSVALSSGDFDFCESAATILGSTIDMQCKASELSALRQMVHCHHGKHQVSTRDIYLRGLGAIYRQLSFPCRLSVLQMRSWSFEGNKIYSSGKCDVSFTAITLLLRLLSIQGPCELVTPLVGIMYLNNVETGRTYTKEQNPSCFKSELFSIPLRVNWLSCRLRVEIWKVESEPSILNPLKVARLIGSAELSGSYYLHLSDCSRAYPLVDTCYQPLSPSLRLLFDLTLQNSTAFGPSTVPAISTSLYQERPHLHLIRASAESMLPQPGQYICVFCAEDGSEYGRTQTSPHTMCPEWNNLNISLSRIIYPTPCTMRVELRSTTCYKSHQVIGSAIVSGSSLIYLPRNLSELRLRLTNMCKTPDQVGSPSQFEQEYIVILLRFGQTRNDVSKLNRNLISYPAASVARLVNGILEFRTVAIAPDAHFRAEARSNAKTSHVVPFSDFAIRIGERIVGPAGGTCFAVVVACAPGALGREHISFIDDVTKLLEANIRHLRHRELRSCARAHGFNRTLAVCKQWASIALPELFNDVLHISSQCLPGCCVYLSLLQPGGDELRCVASNTQSNMYGKRLLRGQGVSFNCLEPATNKDIVVGLSTEHVHVFNQQNYGLPYLCVPLKHHRSRLGVLATDTFEFVSKVCKGPKEHLEDGVLEFLMGLGAIVGRAIDLRRKCDSLASLHIKPFRSPAAILNMSLRAIFSNIIFALACEFWQMDEERKLRAILSVKPGSKMFLYGIWGQPSVMSTIYPYTTDMLLGNLLDAIAHANRMEPKLIGKPCQMIIIPFIELSKCHAISLVPTRDFKPCDAAQSYIMAIAKDTQRILIEFDSSKSTIRAQKH